MSDSRNLRKIMAAAKNEARAAGSSRTEAEHLLLALTSSPQLPAGRLLAEQGLDHEAVQQALALELQHSLAAVGVRLDGLGLPQAALPVLGEPRMAQSAKLAFQRAIKARAARKDRRFDSLHLLIGILSAQTGTVSRALETAGVDRNALATAARSELDHAA